MHLDPYVSQVHDQLLAVSALGDERTQQVAESVAAAAGPAVRLAVLNALADAADEITAALLDHPGSPTVSIRLGGAGDGDVLISVRDTAVPVPAAEPRSDDGDASARISLRLSEALKTDVEAAAARDSVSVNTWLVRAAGAALEPDPLAALGALGRGLGRAAGRGADAWVSADHDSTSRTSGDRSRHHVTGWING